MLRYAILFLIIGVIAGAFGLTGAEGTALYIARILAVVFIILFIVSLVLGRRGTPTI